MATQETLPPPPSCIASTAKGAAIGAVVGAGFHFVAGPSAIIIGQPNLRMQQIAKGAASAALRIGGVFGVFTLIRCTVDHHLLMPLSAPFIAGGVAVAIPTALDSKRTQFLTAYFKEHAGQAMRKPGVIVASAVSGSIVFGTLDTILRYAGLSW